MEAIAKTLYSIVNSPQFDKEQLCGEKLKLSQAFCLLWHDAKSGDVCGRQCSDESNAGVLAAMLVDLAALDKLEFFKDTKTCVLGLKCDSILLKVNDTKPTETFLDAAIFDKILELQRQNPHKPIVVKDLLSKYRKESGTIALDSLVKLDILGLEIEKCGSHKYPTLKTGISEDLKSQLRAFALDGAEPSSYLRALLTLARCSDSEQIGAPVLRKHFTQEEYYCKKAKENLNALVKTTKKCNCKCNAEKK
ncbi:uncharacterized protein LOC110254141 [Exaiptasia diaphana]|uniref:Uncharacterized protein n=1 Tax=Exaiptasia diaphana TaxID=2652724 RepID=A0A913Y8E7_EXADI|nr:uncharacterized protein LOC110254141 [Exaiptasia diaphana]KXJ21401.1 hypothetical protein AC249_AIPGENE8869 [Exaiptasia diaphana]